MSDSTKAQHKAIHARGNILVEAGAGAGKTRTLVERCLAWLLDENAPGSLDEILMVTFTEAAAAEMRHRLRIELDRRAAETRDPRRARHLAEQIALLDRAHICTLHSFCFQLVRQHFYKLGLDPRLILLAPERTAVFERQALATLLDRHYRNESAEAQAIQDLIEAHGKDWDKLVCDLILRVHAYAQSLPDPEGWFASQREYFENPEPELWRKWLMEELTALRPRWLQMLQPLASKHQIARECAAALMAIPAQPSRSEFARALQEIGAITERLKKGKPVESFLKEARFFRSLAVVGAVDPLVEDWNWAREPMLTLLGLTLEFGKIYGRIKQDAGGVDFNDLEQFALRLLLDNSGQPTEIANQWRRKIHMIFVDEYQDINGAQEAIIRAIGREGAEANRFLVGDIKQSIYRFRLADPRIFLRRKGRWSAEPHCQVIALSENFRSHQGILNFVNSLFGSVMRKEVGGIDYDENAELRCGDSEGRPHALAADGARVELFLRATESASDDNDDIAEDPDANATAAPLSGPEAEARLVAQRLLKFHREGTLIWDKEQHARRPVKWSDMVVLLRSPRAKIEYYVKAFDDMGAPLAATRTEFYDTLEVRDLVNLLTILDNPLQDVPALGVLASPLAGLNAAELATIRLARRSGHFWLALSDWLRQAAEQETGSDFNRPLFEKVSRFMENYQAWRGLARLRPVSQCLEQILDKTHYADWLSAQPRGGQRRANVEQLLQLTRAFDIDRGEGLYRFLKFVEAHQKSDADIEPAALPISDAVRIMSIHQSKGLEFPIVVVADLDKKFNMQDSSGRVILDELLGLCPQVKPPGNRRFYPSLAHWISVRRQKRETFGEELRLLYVAATRACDYLVFCGNANSKTVSKKWAELAAIQLKEDRVLNANRYLDWIGSWLVETQGAAGASEGGESALIRWRYCNDEYELNAGRGLASAANESLEENPPWGDSRKGKRWFTDLEARLQYYYPFQPATVATAKSGVSLLRRQVAPDDEETGNLFASKERPVWRVSRSGPNELSATETGSAHHLFLELAQLSCFESKEELREEAARLLSQKLLTEEQVASLDFEAIGNFWHSEAGRQILTQTKHIRRELPFTARFSCAELSRFGAANYAGAGAEEFVVVQGVIDLVVILPKEIWLLDFKTDSFAPAQLPARVESYRPQLALYSAATSRIFGRPVTRCWLHFLVAGKTTLIEEARLKLEQLKLF